MLLGNDTVLGMGRGFSLKHANSQQSHAGTFSMTY